QLGFEEVDAVHDGAGALARLEERAYGLVIADWNMEPMSGLELLRRVRADPALESLPFIMVTTDNRPERMAAADEAGVSDCIIKPFNAATLESRIARAIAG
ncbi:MAG: response regulator, partial [Geminicoccales bacterium]